MSSTVFRGSKGTKFVAFCVYWLLICRFFFFVGDSQLSLSETAPSGLGFYRVCLCVLIAEWYDFMSTPAKARSSFNMASLTTYFADKMDLLCFRIHFAFSAFYFSRCNSNFFDVLSNSYEFMRVNLWWSCFEDSRVVCSLMSAAS